MKITLLSDLMNKPIWIYESGDSYTLGHTNWIFSLKFSDTNPNIFVSGGWDGTMFIWDTRNSKAVSSIFGPMISGDSIDIKDNIILAGSYRDKDTLELYDMWKLNKICNIEWSMSKAGFNYVSSCWFNKILGHSDLIIAGTCLPNSVGIFKKDIVYEQ